MDAFLAFLLILPLAYQTQAAGEWNYEDPSVWGTDYPECNGQLQSPIALSRSTSQVAPLPALVFGYYRKPLRMPLTLENNGHTAEVELSTTKNGNRPYITGGQMSSKYEVVNIHFHWGSPGVKGSEHTINGKRFDVEMHIVHRNVRYETVEEATKHGDGLAVLGIMINIDDTPGIRESAGLNKIFNQLPNVIEYHSNATINGELTLSQVLGNLKTNQFYTYRGSLTTPPCSEAVIWNVFPEPLLAPSKQIEKFFNLKDTNGGRLINNFRPLQPRNDRPVLYRRV